MTEQKLLRISNAGEPARKEPGIRRCIILPVDRTEDTCEESSQNGKCLTHVAAGLR